MSILIEKWFAFEYGELFSIQYAISYVTLSKPGALKSLHTFYRSCLFCSVIYCSIFCWIIMCVDLLNLHYLFLLFLRIKRLRRLKLFPYCSYSLFSILWILADTLVLLLKVCKFSWALTSKDVNEGLFITKYMVYRVLNISNENKLIIGSIDLSKELQNTNNILSWESTNSCAIFSVINCYSSLPTYFRTSLVLLFKTKLLFIYQFERKKQQKYIMNSC